MPFTVMSCDNIQGNGAAARGMYLAFARLKDPALGAGIDHEVRFPCSMVGAVNPRHHR